MSVAFSFGGLSLAASDPAVPALAAAGSLLLGVVLGTALRRRGRGSDGADSRLVATDAILEEIVARVFRHLRRLREDVTGVRMTFTRGRRRMLRVRWPEVDLRLELRDGGLETVSGEATRDLVEAALEASFDCPVAANRMFAPDVAPLFCRLSLDDLFELAERQEIPGPRRVPGGGPVLLPPGRPAPLPLLTEEDVRRRSA